MADEKYELTCPVVLRLGKLTVTGLTEGECQVAISMPEGVDEMTLTVDEAQLLAGMQDYARRRGYKAMSPRGPSGVKPKRPRKSRAKPKAPEMPPLPGIDAASALDGAGEEA